MFIFLGSRFLIADRIYFLTRFDSSVRCGYERESQGSRFQDHRSCTTGNVIHSPHVHAYRLGENVPTRKRTNDRTRKGEQVRR